MSILPPFLIVLDISALLAGNTREWQGFSRIGECFVPKAALEEMEFLCHRAVEPKLEQVAREFARFYPTSGWKAVLSIATHPALKPTEGHALSKKARLALVVAQAAYGVARNHPEGVVVLVANDQALLQRLRSLAMPNLCGIPLAAWLQWTRSLHRPAVVTQQIQAMRSPVGNAVGVHRSTKPTTPSRQAAVAQPSPSYAPRTPSPSWRLRQKFYNLLTLAIALVVVGSLWRAVSPVSFAQFWRQLPIPMHR